MAPSHAGLGDERGDDRIGAAGSSRSSSRRSPGPPAPAIFSSLEAYTRPWWRKVLRLDPDAFWGRQAVSCCTGFEPFPDGARWEQPPLPAGLRRGTTNLAYKLPRSATCRGPQGREDGSDLGRRRNPATRAASTYTEHACPGLARPPICLRSWGHRPKEIWVPSTCRWWPEAASPCWPAHSHRAPTSVGIWWLLRRSPAWTLSMVT